MGTDERPVQQEKSQIAKSSIQEGWGSVWKEAQRKPI